MSVRIEVLQTRSVVEGPLYRVETQVTYVSGIDRNIFVFNTELEEFSHVATTWDMDNLPEGKLNAENEDKNYYRKDVVRVDYATETLGSEAATYTLSRIEYLARIYAAVVDSFIGAESHVYTG